MICCLKVGTKYDAAYVLRLRDGIRRHLPAEYQDEHFVCFTDSPVDGVECLPPPADLPKWWGKTALFGIGKPLVYFDLDTVIVGSLKPLMEWDGFGVIRNPWLPGFNTSVMKLTGNETDVWARFVPGVMATMRGDQDWLNVTMPGARTFPVAWFPSWKVHRMFALDAPPKDAIAIFCHGTPRPCQIGPGWLRDHWIGATP